MLPITDHAQLALSLLHDHATMASTVAGASCVFKHLQQANEHFNHTHTRHQLDQAVEFDMSARYACSPVRHMSLRNSGNELVTVSTDYVLVWDLKVSACLPPTPKQCMCYCMLDQCLKINSGHCKTTRCCRASSTVVHILYSPRSTTALCIAHLHHQLYARTNRSPA